MGSRQVAMYFAWSRPDEENAQLGTLENRFTALFELRLIQWPRQEHLADPAKFDQGIAGFLDHILLANFAMFADFASSLTGNSVRIAQRQTRAAHTALSSQWLVGVDTLIIISWDSNRSKQQATREEIQAVRALTVGWSGTPDSKPLRPPACKDRRRKSGAAEKRRVG